MGDDCGASASAAQSVKESMSSGLPAPSPTKHGCLGGGGGLATAHRRVPLRHVICSFCRCLLESFARWRLSDSLAGSGYPGPSPGHPGCNLGDPSTHAVTRVSLALEIPAHMPSLGSHLPSIRLRLPVFEGLTYPCILEDFRLECVWTFSVDFRTLFCQNLALVFPLSSPQERLQCPASSSRRCSWTTSLL